jgi:flagellar hook-basal body complex protein FliE
MIPALSLVGSVGSLFEASPLTQAAPAAEEAAAATGTGFEQVLAKAGATINDLKAGETAAISGLQGQTPVQEVVESVMTAERSLQTAIAVRDKLVLAYQTISQMPI